MTWCRCEACDCELFVVLNLKMPTVRISVLRRKCVPYAFRFEMRMVRILDLFLNAYRTHLDVALLFYKETRNIRMRTVRISDSNAYHSTLLWIIPNSARGECTRSKSHWLVCSDNTMQAREGDNSIDAFGHILVGLATYHRMLAY